MNRVQTELHRHLDVSLRLSTLLELAQARGLEPQSTSLEAFDKKVILRKPLSDLREVLSTFTLFQRVLDRPEVLERAGFEAVEDCWNEGTRKVELRFSPSFVSEFSKLSWEEVLAGFERGVKRAQAKYPEIQVGLLCIASRDYGPEFAEKTVDFFLKHQSRFVGLDLAGNEENFPCRIFEPAFKKAVKAGARITIHAGEATGPENMWEAIELLGARRIGHGIAAVRDPKLMEYLAKNRICLEMCPTSNWLTRAVPSFESHPLPQVLRAGVPVCINTDDPGVFAVGMADEARICREKMGMTEAEIELCHRHATELSFI
ncbi:MAG: adenosine deaminase [Oligoflexia bacterium]|nr:adenosine deaminase [Oligoflexia bacterium]